MSKKDDIKDRNFIVESIKSTNLRDACIFFYKDKTIELTDYFDRHNIKYIDMNMLKKMIEVCKESEWLDE